MLSLLGTLQQSLEQDLPEIQARLDAADLPGVHQLMHQIKGFAPVFCVDELVAQVFEMESLSRGQNLQALRDAYARLAPRLEQLLAEVRARLAEPR